MTDHSTDEIAPTPVETVGYSPKMLVATVMAGLLGIVVAVLNSVQEHPELLGSLPVPVQSALIALVPPVLAGIAAYRAGPGSVR
jgi:uncharacterized membrane protein